MPITNASAYEIGPNIDFDHKNNLPQQKFKEFKEKILEVQRSAHIISLIIFEIFYDERPIYHIKPWTDPAGYELLSEKMAIILMLRRNVDPDGSYTSSYGPVIKMLRVLPLSSTIFEVSVVAHVKSRFRAIALRLEQKTNIKNLAHSPAKSNPTNWKITAIEIG